MSLHALIIDDEKTNLDVLEKLLSYENVSSHVIQDSRLVAQIVPTIDQLDIIFVDLEIPHINGYDILMILRELEVSAPIVAYTVHTNEMLPAQEQGFDSFIGKPLDANRFPEQLKRILTGEVVWEK